MPVTLDPSPPPTQPGQLTPEEQATMEAVLVKAALERRQMVGCDAFDAHCTEAEKKEEAAKKRRHPVFSLGMGLVPWLARRLNLR